MSARNSFAALREDEPLVVDADTTDYFDDTGLPPPHRFSSALGHSVYPPSQSPRHSYQDPYASVASRQTGSFDLDNPRSALGNQSRRSSFDHNNMPAGGASAAFAAGGAPGTPSFGRLDNASSQALWTNADAGDYDESALPRSHSSQRDRWMNRQGDYGAGAGAGGGGYAYGEKSSAAAKSNRKWWWIGGGVILLIAVIAVIAGVVVSRNNSKSGGNGGLAGVVNGDKNDPSKFTKDPRFHQSFWGMCYTPLDSQYPACGDTLDSVIEDIQIFSQLTKRLRLYGSDCNIAEYVLHAINVTKVDMTVWLTAWLPQPADDPDGSTYQRQVKNVQDAIRKWGVDHIEGVAVGNEYLLNGGSEASLIQHMADMRTALAGMNLSKTVPVGTGDAGSKITETLAAGSDFIQANNHPWFGGVPVEQSGGWVWDYTANNEPATAKQAPNNPKLYVAEVGWPSGANETRFMTEGAGGVAVAGVPNVQILLDTYVCQANTNLTNSDATFDGYMWFEGLAEPWKDALYGGVEAYWGLFDKNKKLLDGLTIPDCTSP